MNEQSSQKTALVVVFLSLVSALVLHGTLTWEFYQVRLGLGEGSSLCNISSALNCAAVAASPYAQLFGVPMALWGFFTHFIFAILLVIYQLGLSEEMEDSLPQVLTGFAAFILLMSIVMGAISLTLLSVYCLFCILAYLTSLTLFWGTWQLFKTTGPRRRPWIGSLAASKKSLAFFLLAIPALSFAGHSIIQKNLGAGELHILTEEGFLNWQNQRANVFPNGLGLSLSANGATNAQPLGQSNVQFVEFIDLFCPHCATSVPKMKAFLQSRPQASLQLMIYPLDGQCNPVEGFPKRDGLRCEWAYALLCSEKLAQKGWQGLDWIFERQSDLSLSQKATEMAEFAKNLGLDGAAFDSCRASQEIADQVVAMAQAGNRAEIQGTPAVFANGKLVQRSHLTPLLDRIYRSAQ